jgi:hypothetical protein
VISIQYLFIILKSFREDIKIEVSNGQLDGHNDK